MIKLNRFKDVLEKNGIDELSEEQMIELRDKFDQMGEVFFAMWLKKTQDKKVDI